MKTMRILAAAAAVAGSAASVSAQVDPIVFDSGYVITCFFNGAASRLGFSAGNLPSAGFPQRWGAQAFTLAEATHVTRLDPQGFVPAGSEFVNLKWVIWRRDAGNPAPTPAAQVATGSVPMPVLVDDPRFDPVLNNNPNIQAVVAPIDVDLNLPAGNYWLCVYGDEPLVAGTDANFAWFTNAQLDNTLTPPNTPIVISNTSGPFMYRSTAYPSPGFAPYTTTAIAVYPSPVAYGPDPQDPQYLYNSAFQIRGTAGAAPCYANCDGSTTAPILNVNDFICFQSKYAAQDPAANCDNSTTQPVLNVNDFICFQSKYAAGCP